MGFEWEWDGSKINTTNKQKEYTYVYRTKASCLEVELNRNPLLSLPLKTNIVKMIINREKITIEIEQKS